MENARIDSKYRNLLKYIYEKGKIKVKIVGKLERNKILVERDVKQNDQTI